MNLANRYRRAIAILLALTSPFFGSGLGCEAYEQGIPAEVTDWLLENATTFDTTEVQEDQQDLAFLEDLIGDASIVALGEATHGTHEFYTMKHRIFRYLVEEMGFTVLAFEMAVAEAYVVDRYVQTGEGASNALEALHTFGSWLTSCQEMVDLIEWMRDYNLTVSEDQRVHVAGVDLQSPFCALRTVKEFLQEAVPSESSSLSRLLDGFLAYEFRWSSYKEETLNGEISATWTECGKQLQSLRDWLVKNEGRLAAATSQSAFDIALHCLIVAQQGEWLLTRFPREQAFLERDTYMADNLDILRENAGPSTRIALWAHNVHVMGLEGYQYVPELKRRHGAENVFVVAFAFYQGESVVCGYNRNDRAMIFDPLPTGRDHYERAFFSTGLPYFALDLHTVDRTTPAGNWLSWIRGLRSAGVYSKPMQNTQHMDTHLSLPSKADLLIYVDTVSGLELLTSAYPTREARPIHDQPVNLGFEDSTNGWLKIGAFSMFANFEADPVGPHSGTTSARLTLARDPAAFQTIIQQNITTQGFEDRRIRISSWMRSQDLDGRGGLWCSSSIPPDTANDVNYRAMVDDPVSGTTGWKLYSIEFTVNPGVQLLSYGVVFRGTGTLWFDDIMIEVLD